MQGEKYTPKGERITEYPAEFKKWEKAHRTDIAKARNRGTEPYFIRNNSYAIDEILNPKQKEFTTLEKAKLRHDARTPEQIKAIKNRWAERQHKHELIKKTADNVLKVASDYGEVDYSKLQQFISAGNITAMQTEARIVAKQIASIKQQEKALSDLIPDAHGWHKQFSMAELQTVHDAVKAKLDSWSSLTLEQQAKKLEFEINYVADPAKYKAGAIKYPTWEVSQSAFAQQHSKVLDKIDWQNINKSMAEAKAFNTKSKPYHELVDELQKAIDNNDKALAQKAIADIQAKRAELDKAAAARQRKKLGISDAALPDMDKAEIERLLDIYEKETVAEADSRLRNHIKKIWATLTEEEKVIVTKYTQTYCYLNEPLRGIPYYGSLVPNAEHLHDLPILTGVLEKFKMPQNTVVRRGINNYTINELGVDLSGLKIGDVFVDKGFLSTAVHRYCGFHKEYNLVICVPKGAKGIYAEPFSHYTDSGKFNYSTKDLWDGISDESMGGEAEWIGQRGSKFKVIKKKGKTIYLQMIGQLQ